MSNSTARRATHKSKPRRKARKSSSKKRNFRAVIIDQILFGALTATADAHVGTLQKTLCIGDYADAACIAHRLAEICIVLRDEGK